MSRWVRLHQAAMQNPKLVTLSDRQHRTWINCLLMANADDGALPKVRDIACNLRMSIPDAELVLSELVEVDLIDLSVVSGMRTLRMHDWKTHQYISDTSTERVRKFRNRNNGNGDETLLKRFSNDGVTPPESYSYTDTKNNLNGHYLEPARAKDQGIRFDVLKRRDDGKTNKLESRAEGLGIPVDDIVAKVIAHKAKNRPAYFTKLCVEWLMPKLPGIDEQILRDALWGKNDQYSVVVNLLMAVTP